MSDVLNSLLQTLNANPELAGVATFFISAMESIAIVGTIVPGTVMMAAIGTLIGTGVIPFWSTVIWAVLGAIVGDGISYWLGHIYKEQLHQVWPFRKYPSVLETGEKFFNKHGSKSVFIGRFVGPVRALVPLVAGMLGMSPLRFTIANITSALGWAPLYLLPGILVGAASLELPPDIAMHVILLLLFSGLLIIFCFWLLYRIFKLIRFQINQFLTWIWNRLRNSRYFYILTTLLKHYDTRKTYGQLTLSFYFLVTISALFYLLLYILVKHDPKHIFINDIFFYFFRSLRTPTWDNIMLAITILGEKIVLAPLVLTLFIWLFWNKHWRTAWHVLALGIITTLSAKILKLWAHSPRPWGILHSPESFSFPSGHTTLAMVFYGAIAMLLIKIYRIKRRRIIFLITGCVILAISFSRIYLGAHWFTDVLGGWLLGISLLMLISLSYNRKAETVIKPTGVVLTIFLTLLISYSLVASLKFDKLKKTYTQLNWPTYSLDLNTWWGLQGKHIPLYRVNRFGWAGQVFNLQWLGDLTSIKKLLLKNGWVEPPERDWISILHRITDVQSTQHVPLVSPLYLNKDPVLVLTKTLNGNRKLIVLRLWSSQSKIKASHFTLWVGNVEPIPRTYSWLFNRREAPFIFSPSILFLNQPSQYDLKQVFFISKRRNKIPIILIKPK